MRGCRPQESWGLLFFVCLFLLFWPRHVACGFLVPQPGIEPVATPLQWKHRVLTTGPPGMSRGLECYPRCQDTIGSVHGLRLLGHPQHHKGCPAVPRRQGSYLSWLGSCHHLVPFYAQLRGAGFPHWAWLWAWFCTTLPLPLPLPPKWGTQCGQDMFYLSFTLS